MRKKLIFLGLALAAAAVSTAKPASAHPACPPGTQQFFCQSSPFAYGCCPIGVPISQCYC
jgi:hypothetical protein